MAKAGATTKALGAEMATLGKNSQVQGALGKFGLSTNMVMGGLVAGGFLGASKAAMDFESSFAGVRKTVDASEGEFAALSQGLRDMATEIPVNVNELANIAEMAGQIGIEKDNILGFTEVIAKLGVTTNLAGEQAASTLAKFANITEMPQSQFANLGATIVALGNAGASTEADIAAFSLRIAGAGEIAGLTEANILGIANAVTSVTDDIESGGTAVQKMLLAMTDSVNSADDRLSTFAKTAGMSAQEFQTAWRADPAKAFTAFVEGLGKAGQDATGILRDLGLSDQRLVKAFLSLAGAGGDLAASLGLSNDAMREGTALNEEAAKRFETTESQIQLAKNSVNDLAIEFGNSLMPAIEGTAEAVAQLATLLTEALSLGADLIGKIPGDLIPGDIKAPWDLGDLFDVSSTDVLTLGISKLLPDKLTDWIPSVEFNPLDWFGDDEAAITGGLQGFIGAWDDVGSAAGAAGAAIASGMDPVLAKIEETKTAYKDLQGILSGATGFLDIESAAIGAESALLDYKDSQGAVNQLVQDGKKGTREYKRALLDQRSAELGVITAQADLEESLISYIDKVESGEVSQRDAIQAVKAFGTAGQLTQSQVSTLIERIKGYDSVLDGLPREKKTDIRADGLTEAQRAIQGWKNTLESIDTNIVTTVSVQTVGSGTYGNKALVQHSGGMAGTGWARYHAGSPPMRTDEVPAILQRGEMVLSKHTVNALSKSRSAPAYPHRPFEPMARVSFIMEGKTIETSAAPVRKHLEVLLEPR